MPELHHGTTVVIPGAHVGLLGSSGGEPLVTDSQFVDAKEVVAGFYVIDAPDLDAALKIAGRNPVTHLGAASSPGPSRVVSSGRRPRDDRPGARSR